jgi:hypothetical protein
MRSLIISRLTVAAALCLRGPASSNGVRAVIAPGNRRNGVTLRRGVMPTIRGVLVIAATLLATGIAAVVPAGASASVNLNGSFSTAIVKPDFTGPCPSGVVVGECGTMQLAGLGAADWAYAFGPAFEPDGRCFDVDGTLTLTLQSDGSTISGPLTGVFCPGPSATAHQHAGAISYGNPFVEDDSIAFTGGTGQFDGLSGTASFHTFGAGARFTGTLTGTLTG